MKKQKPEQSMHHAGSKLSLLSLRRQVDTFMQQFAQSVTLWFSSVHLDLFSCILFASALPLFVLQEIDEWSVESSHVLPLLQEI